MTTLFSRTPSLKGEPPLQSLESIAGQKDYGDPLQYRIISDPFDDIFKMYE